MIMRNKYLNADLNQTSDAQLAINLVVNRGQQLSRAVLCATLLASSLICGCSNSMDLRPNSPDTEQGGSKQNQSDKLSSSGSLAGKTQIHNMKNSKSNQTDSSSDNATVQSNSQHSLSISETASAARYMNNQDLMSDDFGHDQESSSNANVVRDKESNTPIQQFSQQQLKNSAQLSASNY